MSISLCVLIVEDSDDDATLIVQTLRQGGYDPTFERVDTPEAFRYALDQQAWDCIIADYSMPRFSGLDALMLTQECELDLPPVRGDSVRLRQVSDNLLGNAGKLTPAGGQIIVRLHRKGENLLLEVEDTWIGIPHDHLDRILERFYQVE
jgi:signal transduction histidine kinase